MSDAMKRSQTAKAWVADMLERDAGPDALAYHLTLLLKKERADERKRCAVELRAWCDDEVVEDKVNERAVQVVRAVSISVEHGWPNFPGISERVDAVLDEKSPAHEEE